MTCACSIVDTRERSNLTLTYIEAPSRAEIYGARAMPDDLSRMPGAGVYAGSCDDLVVAEEQIAIVQETMKPRDLGEAERPLSDFRKSRARLAVVET